MIDVKFDINDWEKWNDRFYTLKASPFCFTLQFSFGHWYCDCFMEEGFETYVKDNKEPIYCGGSKKTQEEAFKYTITEVYTMCYRFTSRLHSTGSPL